MQQAKISEFKAKLSSYIAKVRHGETVTVYDRDTPVAQLIPLKSDSPLVMRPPSASMKGICLHGAVDVSKEVFDVVAELRLDRERR